MELIIALAIGVFTTCGVWLLLRPRTFQVIIGLSLLSYAVNLFIFGMGRMRINAAPVLDSAVNDLNHYTDPVPQSLVLTAIVIGFAMTAFLVGLAIALYRNVGHDRVRPGHHHAAGPLHRAGHRHRAHPVRPAGDRGRLPQPGTMAHRGRAGCRWAARLRLSGGLRAGGGAP